MALIGREVELAAIAGHLEAARDGMSAALVIQGEAGVGKTALLRHVADTVGDFQVASVSGHESEVDLGFATLHRLLQPFTDAVQHLPAPQLNALSTAFGLREGTPPDAFMVGLATLTLLTDVAGSRPVLAVIDDVQWIDAASLSVLTFVARRLHADSVAMLFGLRTTDIPLGATDGLEVLTIGGLARADARRLLESAPEAPFVPHVVERLIDEAGGNPLTLLELGRELSREQREGTRPLPDHLPIGADIEARYLTRVRALPQATQDLLLVAAAEPSEPEAVWHAAHLLGIDADEGVMTPALDAQLVSAGHAVEFRHPLVRSAIYQGARPSERRQAHKLLASAIGDSQPDRQAWHRAAAAVGPDAEIADALELAAGRARNRGGRLAEVTFLDRSAQLTPEAGTSARRFLDAAYAAQLAGATTLATSLVERAEATDPDGLEAAHVLRLHGLLELAGGQFGDSTRKLFAAARSFAPHDHALARETLLETFNSLAMIGRYVREPAAAEVAAFALSLPGGDPDAPTEMLLRGWSLLFVDERDQGVALLRRALDAFVHQGEHRDEAARWTLLATLAARELWEDDTFVAVAANNVRRARELGDLMNLEIALLSLAAGHVHGGRLAEADACYTEVRLLKRAIAGSADLNEAADLQYRAWRGHDEDLRTTARAIYEFSDAIGFDSGVCIAQLALTTVELSEGRYEAALEAAQTTIGGINPGIECRALGEIVEAAERSGHREIAEEAFDRIAPSLISSQTDWGLGVLARLRGILASDEDAEAWFMEALERLGRAGIVPDLARTHLLYGEWLRRQGRRTEARDQLRTAHDLFTSIRADGYAERARRELLATGERARRRTADTANDLTPQELQVARLAAEGLTNREIAAQLFLSASTVEYHLHKTFRKLDITSRHQLTRVLQS